MVKEEKKYRIFARMASVLSALVLLGTVVSVNAASSKAAADNNQVKDGDIVNAIESEFIFDYAVPFNAIDILCKDGIVTLEGTVETIREKERAKEIAATITGVRGIVNMLTVKPVDRPDEELRQTVAEALFSNPATDSYEIRVTVKNGVVTLKGTVESWQEKQLCATVTKGVKGVRDVKNSIGVSYETKRPDYEIKTEIEERLANDVRIDDKLIDVKVKKGKVTLSGTVGSMAEKGRALLDGYVAGVNDVSADKLEVRWWARNSMRRKGYFFNRTDEEIKKAVKDAFVYDPRVLSYNPGVRVDNGTVTLYGTVGYLGAKRAAQDDAQNVTGVFRVINHLKVRPDPLPGNEKLKNKIVASLSKDPFVDRFDIAVDVTAGFVTLSGMVNSSYEKERAETVAMGVDGVVDILNTINFAHKWMWKPDWEIKSDVREQLYWDAMLTEKDVGIEVNQGVVILTGTVDNWIEWRAAEENAYAGGAKDVINNLLIRYG